MEIEIIYKNKKNSSGIIRNGRIVLYISANVPLAHQQEHIKILQERLLHKAQNIKQQPISLIAGEISDDKQLFELAKKINEEYYNYFFKSITFKKQQSRWGSCSLRSKKIYISHKLKNAPLDLISYVVVHELCHLQEANHGPKFWRLVEKACPNWRECRKKLRFLNIL
ncbi:MAG: M48 family metallopeptidase [Bacillota bacterium]